MKQAMMLLMNDIHIAKDDIPAFQDNWNEAFDICQQHDIHNIVVGGDMFQSRSSQTIDVLLAVKNVLIKAHNLDIGVTIAEGNHDKINQESYDGYNQIFSEYPGVYVVDDYTIMEVSDDVELYVMSYFPENGSFIKRFKEMVDTELDKDKKSILYLHEGIRGGLATPSEDELPATIFKDFDSVLVGHYHNRKKIAGTNVEYIGSSRQHNFGEDEEKGYTIFYSDGSYEFVKNNVNVRYKVVDIIDIKDLNESLLNRIDKLRKSGKYKIKVRVNCKSSEVSSIDKQRLIDFGVTKLEIITEQTKVRLSESQSIEKKFDKAGIKEEYSKFCLEHGVHNVEMGLSYLDKIK